MTSLNAFDGALNALEVAALVVLIAVILGGIAGLASTLMAYSQSRVVFKPKDDDSLTPRQWREVATDDLILRQGRATADQRQRDERIHRLVRGGKAS